MKHILTLAAALLVPSAANAATIVLNNGQPYTYVVHANSAGSGTSLNLVTMPGGHLVNLSSPQALDVGNGNGVAQASGNPASAGFSEATIDPLLPILGFSVIQFKIEGPNGSPRERGRDLDITVNFVGGGSQTFSDFALPANDKIDIIAQGSEVIESVRLFGLINGAGNAANFDALKQISFEAVFAPVSGVPEPAAWALMLGGFGIAGSALRRRKHTTVLA